MDVDLKPKFHSFAALRRMLRSIVLILALALLALFFFANATSPKRTKIVINDGKKFYETTIAGAKYHIPTGYFRPSDLPPTVLDEDIYFHAAMPDFHYIISGGPDSPEVTKTSWGTVAHLLITDAGTTTPLDVRWGVENKRYGPLTHAGEAFGLQKYITSKGPGGMMLSDAVIYVDRKRLANPTTVQKKGALEELYTDTRFGVPTVYILCSGDYSAPSPSCSQSFVSDGLLFGIDYGKSNLKNWQIIHSESVKMMRSFKINFIKEN